MTELRALMLDQEALMMTLLLSTPMIIAWLAIGLVVSVFQAVTEINEATLSFVPKIIGIFTAMSIRDPWLLYSLLGYTVGMFNMLPSMVRYAAG